MPTPPPSLANAELAVMDVLWDDGTVTARQVRERLYPGAAKAQHGTVQRLLQRLEDKGVIARDRTLAVHLFRPLISREAYAGGELERLTEKLTGGSLAPVLTHLVEQRRITEDELARLRAILGEPDPGPGPQPEDAP